MGNVNLYPGISYHSWGQPSINKPVRNGDLYPGANYNYEGAELMNVRPECQVKAALFTNCNCGKPM